MNEITRILDQIQQGDPHASEQLLPLVYDELRKLAERNLAREIPGQTLQATALVHEAYLRLVTSSGKSEAPDGPGDNRVPQHWNGRGHFFAAAAEAMRRILVENARRKRAEKRGGRLRRLNLNQIDAFAAAPPDDFLALDEALERLTHHDPEAAQLVKLHCLAGLTVEQAAQVLGLSRSSAYRLWTFARAWLHDQWSTSLESNF